MGIPGTTGNASRRIPVKRPTITDIAELAGVSRTTVSLVLRDADKIPQATKAKVHAAIDELGYVYNRVGAAVRAGQSSLLGLLLTDVHNPFFAEVAMAVDRAVVDQGWSVLLSYSFADPEHEATTARSLAEHMLGGLILLPTPVSDAEHLRFLTRAQPLVQLLREVPGLESDHVGVDNLESGRLLGEHLAEQGHRSVVLVGGSMSPQLEGRRAGLEQGLGAPVEIALGGVEGLAALLERGTPGCVVTYNDRHMLAVLSFLRSRGLEPGHQIGVASFDNTSVASLLTPAITSVDHHASTLAQECVRLIKARGADPGRPLERVLVPPTLVVRGSTQLH